MNFESLRKKHAQFIYEGFNILHEDGNLKVTFDFLLMPDIRFRPFVVFPKVSKERLDKIGPEVLQNLAFNLGIIELISYWKAACPPEIIIKAGFLDGEQISFWKKLLIKGLGEFFYNNRIDFTRIDLFKFVILNPKGEGSLARLAEPAKRANASISETSVAKQLLRRTEILPPHQVQGQNDNKKYDGKLEDRDLVLVGGGKDSAVTLESISQKGKEFNCLILNPTDASIKIAEIGGCRSPITIKRTIDPKLLELNRQGYLNGHTPFSAYLAFLSTLVGVVYDYKNLVVSSEASSNEGNVEWLGQEINHQYSKTSEFEQDFRDYSKKYLATFSNYFSFLRPLGELQISKTFSKMKKYHKLFRSCNRGLKQGVWCGECPKCVSTYLLLYPFLGEKTEEIFGKNLLEDDSLIPVVRGLLRENNEVKPFECVATVEEIKVAIYLGIQYSKSEGKRVPLVLRRLAQHGSDGENK